MAVIMSHLPSVIFLMGPTAAGKTETALELVRRLPCEIVSVDSALVYRGMDIGTAKPDAEVMADAPHRLIDIRDPAEPYSAAEFRKDALHEMADIVRQGRIPLLVGGTMLYFRALQQGLSELPSADPLVRARLQEEAGRLGAEAMHARLAAVDPVAAQRIHPNDPQRVQRALEVYEMSGVSMTELYARRSDKSIPYRIIKLILAPASRDELHHRIEQRLNKMLEAGLVNEVERLSQRRDLHPELPSMRAVGYRQVWAYLRGEIGYEEMIKQAIFATRQLAKRQLTWLRSEEDAAWFDSGRSGTASLVLKHIKTFPINNH